MNKLRSEILFNRALIWTAISLIEGFAAGNKKAAWLSVIPSIYNIWKSFEAWNEVDE